MKLNKDLDGDIIIAKYKRNQNIISMITIILVFMLPIGAVGFLIAESKNIVLPKFVPFSIAVLLVSLSFLLVLSRLCPKCKGLLSKNFLGNECPYCKVKLR